VQLDGLGFALVEVLSPCPTNWKMDPVAAYEWTDKEMTKIFPLGVIKDITGYDKD
jgi:pyruvate/2-oxoacid:ferredoxin oxidoreductase beta subunit